MTQQVDTLVPDARWWLAHDGCGALLWEDGSGIIRAANAAARRLLGPDAAWTAGRASIRDVFDIADGLPADLVAGLRVVLMSGYPSEMLTRAGNGGPALPFVNKPIDFPTLAQLLSDPLERREPWTRWPRCIHCSD